jgi:hypothetical protein
MIGVVLRFGPSSRVRKTSFFFGGFFFPEIHLCTVFAEYAYSATAPMWFEPGIS